MRPVVLAWWNRKLRNDPSAFLWFDSHSSNRYCSFSRREKSASKGSRGCCEPLPKEHFGVGLQFQGVAADFPLVAQRGTQNDWSSSPHIIFRTDMGRVRIISDRTPRQRPGPATWKTLAGHPVGFVSVRALPPEGINATPSPLAGQAASLADKVLVILGTKDEDCRLHRVHVSLSPAERNPVKFLFLMRKRPDESVGGKPYFANPKSSRGLAAPVTRPRPTADRDFRLASPNSHGRAACLCGIHHHLAFK